MVETIDLFPTVVEAAGFKPPEKCTKSSKNFCTDGESLLPLMENTKKSKQWKNTALTKSSGTYFLNDFCLIELVENCLIEGK